MEVGGYLTANYAGIDVDRKKIKRIGLLFGGRSSEHEVSLSSAVGVLRNIDRRKYEVVPIKITREGEWQRLSIDQTELSPEKLDGMSGSTLLFQTGQRGGLVIAGRSGIAPPLEIDIFFPLLHGTFGEDGTVQGLLSLAGFPFVGAGVAASAAGMDKVLMKQLFFQNDLPGPDYLWFPRSSWKNHQEKILNGAEKEIGLPCFIKPANGGSSVGISKAHSRQELREGVELAAEYDRKIIIEKYIEARELECAVLGNDDPTSAEVGEIIPGNEFYDYEAKYISDSDLKVPADITRELRDRVRGLAVAAFKAIDCAGMARVDFFYQEKDDILLVNEINTIPGFTPISMYPKLWEAAGLSYTDLISRLIELGLERGRETKNFRFQR